MPAAEFSNQQLAEVTETFENQNEANTLGEFSCRLFNLKFYRLKFLSIAYNLKISPSSLLVGFYPSSRR
jgi:hypothetical protein